MASYCINQLHLVTAKQAGRSATTCTLLLDAYVPIHNIGFTFDLESKVAEAHNVSTGSMLIITISGSGSGSGTLDDQIPRMPVAHLDPLLVVVPIYSTTIHTLCWQSDTRPNASAMALVTYSNRYYHTSAACFV
jgi:hypothetical protein